MAKETMLCLRIFFVLFIEQPIYHCTLPLKGLFHPACLARVVSWFAFVVAIFMGHENGDKQKPTKSRHVQGMLDETDPLIHLVLSTESPRPVVLVKILETSTV